MHRITVTALSALAFVATSVHASEVFVTRDAQGHLVYTDRPESLPAARVNVVTKQTDVVEVQARYDQQMKELAETDTSTAADAKKAAAARKAADETAADKAKRCQQARANYETVMNARRLYEPGATADERRYLDSQEIDDTRAKAKQVMDEFCAGL